MNRSTSSLDGGILLTLGSLVCVMEVASKSDALYGGSFSEMSTMIPTCVITIQQVSVNKMFGPHLALADRLLDPYLRMLC